MKKLKIHRPTKKIYTTDNDFGHYLAGIIDGEGHFSKQGQIVVSFNERDIRHALKLRSQIGYGKIRAVKDKAAVNWIISNKKGALKVMKLIHNKIRHPEKIKQFNDRLCNKYEFEFTENSSIINWESSWFSGFFDTDGYLRIYNVIKKERHYPEIRLLAQIDQKSDILLKQFKENFGGYLGYRKKQDTYYYSTTSYNGMYLLLKHLDKYSVQCEHYYLRYTILRKAYILVQNGTHLTEIGREKIRNLDKTLKDMR